MPDQARSPHRWAMLAGVTLVYASFGSTSAAIAPLVSRITAELGLSHTQMGTVLGAWQFVYIGAAIPCGALLDRLGPGRCLTVGALIIAASGIARGFADGYLALLFAVAAFGVGGPLVSVGAPTVISQWFQGRERGLAMGVYNAGQAVGTIGALSLTSSLGMAFAHGNWRAVLIFYGGFALAAALAWAAISLHPASRAAARRAAAVGPRATQGLAFVELVRARPVRIVLALAVGSFFFSHGLANWLPEILRVGGMNAAAAGLWSSIPVLVGIGGSLVFPRLAVPSRRMKILAGLFLAQMLAPLFIDWSADGALIVGLALQGLVRGALSTILVLVLIELKAVEQGRTGAAVGLYFTAGELGGWLGPSTIGKLYDLTGGFNASLLALAGLCAWQLWLLSRLGRALR
jgi:cyanate permease